MYNIKHILNTKQIITAYRAIIFSNYNYGIELYGNCTKSLIAKLQYTQNRLLKIILSKNKSTSTNKIHYCTNLLKIKDNYKLRLCLQIHKIMHEPQKIPNDIKKDIQTTNSIHNRQTRNNMNIYLTTKTFCKKYKIMEAASILWNTLNPILKQIKNRNSFKNELGKTLLENYE